jgi:succinyl-CoA synthetase beta subunit
MKLLEDRAKAWLRGRGLPAPEGAAAASVAEAREAARGMGGRVAVKALVAAGRRGKAGAVALAADAEGAAAAAAAILNLEVAGQRVAQVYVEQAVEIASELYLSFGFGRFAPQVVASRRGGVDIETVASGAPEALVTADVDPILGLQPWEAARLWERAGVESKLIPALGQLTVRLYDAFRAGDALMLEINPLAVARDGALSLVGAMMEVDDSALFRHPDWQALPPADGVGRLLSERERAVIEADRKFAGGAIRYTELDGDIALFVSGGGAGLLQHDLVVAAGGRVANHSDLSPASAAKPAALFDAIFANPRVRGVLVGMNYLQLLPCTVVTEALLISLKRNNVDATRLPIVLRVFGPKENEARAMAATVPGLRYMPHGATLGDAVREIVVAVKGRGA